MGQTHQKLSTLNPNREKLIYPPPSQEEATFQRFHPVLSVLSYLLKAPLVPSGTPVVNALFAQRQVSADLPGALEPFWYQRVLLLCK